MTRDRHVGRGNRPFALRVLVQPPMMLDLPEVIGVGGGAGLNFLDDQADCCPVSSMLVLLLAPRRKDHWPAPGF